MLKKKPPICKLAVRLAENIRARRGNTPTLVEYGEKIGISKSSLARVLSEQENVTLMTLQKMCDHLGCDIGDLFTVPNKADGIWKEKPNNKSAK